MTPLQRGVYRVIWVALAVSMCIYGVIDWIVIGKHVHLQPLEQELRSPLVLGLYGAAVLMFIAALRFTEWSKQPIFVARLAFFESCAIFGLVASFLTNDWRLFLPTWALAMLGFLQTLPPSAEYTPGP